MQNKYVIFNQFIDDRQCRELNDWIFAKQKTWMFRLSGHPGTKRFTTRFSEKSVYPKAAYEVQKMVDEKIKQIFDLTELIRTPTYPDGMYASFGTQGDTCKTHTDPRYINNFVTYHFNIFLSDYLNGKIVIEDEVVEVNKKDGILYPVSEIKHGTTELTGASPRLYWCFGYCIPLQKTDFKL